MSGRLDVHFSSKTDCWETPRSVFDQLDAEFGFELDVCAIPENAKCAQYFTPVQNGLIQEWRGSCWMNPPYGKERPLFPLVQLQRAKLLIHILSKFKDRWVKPLSLTCSHNVFGEKFDGDRPLFFFDYEKWQDFGNNNNGIFTAGNPFPSDPFTELSRILSTNCSDIKKAGELLYSGLVNHFHLDINSICGGIVPSAGCSSFTLIDAYATLSINQACRPTNKLLSFHDSLLLFIGGYIKNCKNAIPGIKAWLKKAYESAQSGATVVCLVPARTDTSWWHTYAIKGEIRFIRGRLKFGGQRNSAPFPSAVVIFRGQHE